MKSLLKLALVCIVAYIAYSAYVNSQSNGKTFWNNAGKESKVLLDKGIKATDGIVKESKKVGNELSNGFNNSTNVE